MAGKGGLALWNLDFCRSLGHNFMAVDSGAVMAQGPVAHLKNDDNI
jgi:ABC-type uncharacterized transport system ATPase subunit